MDTWAHVLMGTLALSLGGVAGYAVWREKDQVAAERKRYEGHFKALIPRSHHTYDPREASAWLARLAHFQRTKAERRTKGAVWFRLRIEKSAQGDVWFWLLVPEDREQGVLGTLPSTLECHEVPSERKLSIHLDPTVRMDVSAKHVLLPFSRETRHDPLLILLRAMGKNMAVEIRFSPIDETEALRLVEREHKRFDPNVRDSGVNPWAQLASETAAEFGRALTGRQVAKSRATNIPQKPQALPHQRRRIQGVLQRYEELGSLFWVTLHFEGDNKHRARPFFQGMLGALRDIAAENELVMARSSRPFVMSAEELAQLVHVPSPDAWPQMPVIREHAKTLRDDEFAEGVAIGYLRHPTQASRLVRIPYAQFTRHFLMTGMTGAGKSTTLIFLLQSILNDWVTQTPENPKPGLTLIDPAAETTLIFLSRLQAALPKDSPLWKKVHYISFSNRDYPVALNLLQVLTTEAIVATLSKAYGGGARIDEIIDMCVQAFKEDDEVQHVLAGMIPMLKDENWRFQVLRRLKSPLVRTYWEQTFPAQAKNPDYYAPVERRLRPFVTSSTALYFGQPEYALPIRQWMDEGHILLIDVKALSPELMSLIMGGLIEQYYHVALTRPESTSLTHFLLVDECHRVQTDIMAKIIAETRKFGLSLGMITQSVEQFSGELKKAIKDVLGNFFSLRVGADSARIMADLTQGHFTPEYLRALPDNVAAVYTVVSGKAQSCETQAPPPDIYAGFAPNARVVDFFDKPALRKRYEELRAFGHELQKELGRPAREAAERLNFYLEHGTWPEQASTRGRRGRPRVTVDDLY